MCFNEKELFLFTINDLLPSFYMFLFSLDVLKLSFVAYWARHVWDI